MATGVINGYVGSHPFGSTYRAVIHSALIKHRICCPVTAYPHYFREEE